jgi:micrococcal nuclease
MTGTKIRALRLTKVVDGDTVRVMMDGTEEKLRLACLDTEESYVGGSKPVTKAGKLASKWAKEFFGADDEGTPRSDVSVDIEFDTDDPEEVCKVKHRGNYGRLICYVYLGDVNYNLTAVEEGWSPYFVKYGRSRIHHRAFQKAEAAAQSRGIAIWDPATNAGGASRDYDILIPWWHLRDAAVCDYRSAGGSSAALSVRLDHAEIVQAAEAEREITVLCDLQNGIEKYPGDGALIYAGSRSHPLNLWIDDRQSASAQGILRLIETRYAGHGRGYVYVTGKAVMYPKAGQGRKPEIVLTDSRQLGDAPR